jgi:hypothetical protein
MGWTRSKLKNSLSSQAERWETDGHTWTAWWTKETRLKKEKTNSTMCCELQAKSTSE